MKAVPMVEFWRGGLLESLHHGHAVICDADGAIVEAWGDPDAVIFPRSSCKMIQALPLIESGAADAFGVGASRLALACASHQGAAVHSDLVTRWLADLGLGDDDLRCGPQMPRDADAMKHVLCGGESPCRIHNNCSGKHSGFLTLARHLGAGPEYHEADHPVQIAVRHAFEEVTGVASPGYGIDGCSAPNFATTVHGLARAMAFYAGAGDGSDTRSKAAARLVSAMTAFPELVAGEGRACTNLMRAMGGKVAVKTGAEAVFVAILPERRMGIALKILDGAERASEAAIVALLIRLGALDPGHPVVRRYLSGPIRNHAGQAVGERRLAAGFAA
ncbi:asparaginase [Defluviimonas sp. WL0002]|uniref:Asparaginase n=1 Tax=Albidovulum marisflavi TaxID=2984159 RepID=A0ABT2ZAG3_9RHOB|nr:asparaginase [Defluviimonas sp. WL0002]MCV2867766.1 asparaginase [Defluviimonas sp. WL0002]